MMYRPKYFTLAELADPAIIAERGEQTWNLLRPDMLMMLDALRDKFGPLTVNGQYNLHDYTESGLRRPDTKTGSKWSMHKLGGAFDCKFRQTNVMVVYEYVLAHPDEFTHINAVEDIAVTGLGGWLHIDGRNNTKRIQVIQP